MLAIGVDIGGTKCEVCLGNITEGQVNILHKCKARSTQEYTPEAMLGSISQDILYCKGLVDPEDEVEGIGISCGGPLNSKKGIILSPPNLPGWDNIHITRYLKEKTGIKAWLCNDANACALAEWKLGAGKGCSNIIFMTFGTGLGAGIILNGQLYTGTNDMAGELGHIRLSEYGPAGYGKMGSFEGFCSGGGIAQLAKSMMTRELQKGNKPEILSTISDADCITAKEVGLAAKNGDMLALEILKYVGIQLGKGLSMLIDLLNPEKIIIGSIFVRCYDHIWPWAEKVIAMEALSLAKEVCQVVPSQLAEDVGDIASLIVAEYNWNMEKK